MGAAFTSYMQAKPVHSICPVVAEVGALSKCLLAKSMLGGGLIAWKLPYCSY